MFKGHNVAVVIPALNEQDAIGIVVQNLLSLQSNNAQVIDSIVVCDNGSTDNTASVAQSQGAHVVHQSIAGYGIACLTAIAQLPPCDIVLFIDGDDSCFVAQAIDLLNGIVNGDDLAIGSRTLGNVEAGALTTPQLFGNWLSSRLITLFWGQTITDLGPFRAIRTPALRALNMADERFGWTVEMQVKAIIQGMQVSEYSVDSKVRIGESKISGTLSGSIKAGMGILSMIATLFFRQSSLKNSQISNQ
jgi:glycosyltransferase involved in cell wall biosynthesis